jgi:hypothetical protein
LFKCNSPRPRQFPLAEAVLERHRLRPSAQRHDRPGTPKSGIKGSTAEAIAQAGNIRTDMLEQLLIADIANADISIYNAGVYYELGIRHSLRARTTILVRASPDEVPFELKTDRYLEDNANDPASARAHLTEAVRQSTTPTARCFCCCHCGNLRGSR